MLNSESSKLILILVLLFLLVLSTLGANVISPVFTNIEKFGETLWGILYNLLKSIGYSTGEIVTVSSDTAANVAKSGIDITNGALKDAGNLLKGQPGNLDDSLQHPRIQAGQEPRPTSDSDRKQQWCFVEKKDGKNNCKEIGPNDKCDSGKTFNSQSDCMKA